MSEFQVPDAGVLACNSGIRLKPGFKKNALRTNTGLKKVRKYRQNTQIKGYCGNKS